MTADDAIAALDLPAAARIDRRVPKTLLLEHGAPTAADRRRIAEGIEHLQWVAVLKPTTIGVAAHSDEAREYLEIAVLRLTLRSEAALPRVVELVHRAVPYPVLAIAEVGDRLNLSLAHKRRSQGEAGRTVLEEEPMAVDAPGDGDPHGPAFAAALALGRQPRASLLPLYQGWLDAIVALQAAHRTGRFEVLSTVEARAGRLEALRCCARLEVEIARLRAAAAREKQVPRQVEMNLELKRAEGDRDAAFARLRGTW